MSAAIVDLAYKLLKAHDFSDLIFGFSRNHIVEADRQKLRIVARLEDLRRDRLDGGKVGVSIHTYGTLGHIVSKVSFMIQKTLDGTEKKDWVQNTMLYTHLEPQPSGDIYILGTSLRGQCGTHTLQFAIESDATQGKIYGTGSSTILVSPTNPLAAALSAREAVGQKGRRDGSSGSEALPPLSSGPATSASAAAPAPAPMATAPTTTATSRPQAVTAPAPPPLVVSAPVVVPPSIRPRSASKGLSTARPRPRASFVAILDPKDLEKKEKTEEYMVVNIKTRHPKTDKKLEKMLADIGVTATEIRYEALPTIKSGSYVFYFKVTSTKGCSRVENVIEKTQWQDLFHIIFLCSENSDPYFWKALPIPSILEASLLAQRVALRADQRGEEDDLDRQLSDPKYLRDALKDVSFTEEVVGGLNQRGKAIFRKQIQPKSSM